MDKRCVHCLPQGEAKMIYNRREAVRRCAEVVGLGDLVDDLRYGFGQDRADVFLTAARLEPPEKAAFVQVHLGARYAGAPDSSVQAYPVSKNSEISQITGSESFERASRALRDTAKRCGKLCAHRLSDPQLPCASPEAASTDVLPHVASKEQKLHLEALSRTEARTKLVKWPVDEATEIVAVAKRAEWPRSVWSYVEGQGAWSGPRGT